MMLRAVETRGMSCLAPRDRVVHPDGVQRQRTTNPSLHLLARATLISSVTTGGERSWTDPTAA